MEYGLIGEHLGHSYSAIIHGKIAPYQYALTELTPEELPCFMQKKDFKAINVTIPYKQAVIPFIDVIEENARNIGAVNTVVNRGGKLYGYNTDYYGMKALAEKIGVSMKDKKVLILGTGGTSNTAYAVAESLGAKIILKVSRHSKEDIISYEDACSLHTDAEYIINTTPCGMYPYPEGNEKIKGTPIDLDCFSDLKGVLDVVFNPLRTNLVCEAKKRGIPADGGLYMLVAQAVIAAEKFLDTVFDKSIIDKIYNELRADKENIVLVGMPGCGKSTIGEAIAKKQNRIFIDSDAEIVRRTSKEIPDIFSDVGEVGFRAIEADTIAEIAATVTGAVISTGGGAILRDDNVLRLKRGGKLYFLDRKLEYIRPTPDRPLSMDRAALEARYEERYPRYLQVSDCHLVTNENSDDTIQKIEEDFFS